MLSWTGRGGGASDTSSSNIWLAYYLMDLKGQGPWGLSRMSPRPKPRMGDPLARLGKGENRKRQEGSGEVKSEKQRIEREELVEGSGMGWEWYISGRTQ